MECIPAHLLTNAEIIQIFKERQLDIPDVEKLSRNDLVTIFKNFAVPLDKRNITRKKIHLSSSSSESLEKMDCSSSDENILTDNNDKITRKRNQSSKVVSDTVTKMSRITLKLNVNGNTLKRNCPSEQILLLNIPPKRNKITST